MTIVRRMLAFLLLLAATGPALSAQNTPDRIRLGITYSAGARPGIVVVAGAGLDSVRAIIERDLDYSDRFEIARVSESVARGATPAQLLQAFKAAGITWAVELQAASGGVTVKLHELAASSVRQQGTRPVSTSGAGEDRLPVHRISDEIVQWATGGVGIAATRMLFSMGNDIHRIDSDGANLVRVSRGNGFARSAAWSPDGSRVAFSEQRDYAGVIIVQNLATGSRQTVPTAGTGTNTTPAFSPNGRELAFAKVAEDGTNIYVADIARMCCASRLTSGGKLAVNMSPTYSPDGRSIAFVSRRAGAPQIHVMDSDGSGQRFLVPLEFGLSGGSYAPDWSPDGGKIIFARDLEGGSQLHVFTLGSGRTAAVTSTGRNEDPSWAPDSRHVVFVSNRSGRGQMWILDLESGRSRQVVTPGAIRLPAWSPRLAGTNP
jgi:TolB protein